LRPKTRHKRFESSWPVAETFSGLIERKAIDKDGAQRLVTAVQGIFGLMKETSAHLVVHDAGPGKLTNYRATPAENDIPN
jgi:hypothetical protein